ncbi:MAG: hypothetical protein LBP75_03785 [Planctomycetota bacterium]|jgi:hypothetical protein|nr:hypothetical protein [Planctomycetota bacterium]
MQILPKSAAVVLFAAAMLNGARSDEAAQVKNDLAAVQAEMTALRAEMAAQRANTGGEPEALRSANGNATLRLGGDFRAQYATGWANDVHNAAGEGGGNKKSQGTGWAISTAHLTFDVDLAADTRAYVSLSVNGDGTTGVGNLVDNAYFEWRNVGGAEGFALKVGLQYIPFGMYGNDDFGGYQFGEEQAALISTPLYFTWGKNFAGGFRNAPVGVGDFGFLGSSAAPMGNANLGLFTQHNWNDEVMLKAGIMASPINGLSGKHTTFGNDAGVNNHNEYRSLGFTDHVVALLYNPGWLEGLHLEASYVGQLDDGYGEFWTDANGNISHQQPQGGGVKSAGNSGYTPSVDIAAVYKVNDKLKFVAEGVVTWNAYYGEGTEWGAAVGADYRLTDKLTLAARLDTLNGSYDDGLVPMKSLTWYRANFGGKYDFGNSIYVKAQYYHDWLCASGYDDGNWKDADGIILETGYSF